MAAPRSPRYPNISLSEAITRARLIYEREHMSTMTPPVAAEAMGYKGISGASLKTISALKKYGLLDGRADDVRLTKDAQTLIIDDPSSAEYIQALVRAASGPEIFVEISKQFPGHASERNISVFLEKQGFRSDAAATVAKFYKDSQALVSGAPAQYHGGEEPIEAAVNTVSDQPRRHPSIRFAGGGEGIPVANHRYDAAPERVQPVGDLGAPFRITMDGKKLHIIADVDLNELQVLKQMLDSYEGMLRLLRAPAGQAVKPEWADKVFAPGETVPASGIYAPQHDGHSGYDRVQYNQGQRFMSCDECADRNAVRYTYVDPIP